MRLILASVNFLLSARRNRRVRSRAISMCRGLSQNAHGLIKVSATSNDWPQAQPAVRTLFSYGAYQTHLGLVGKSGIKTRPKAAQTTVMRPSTIWQCQRLPRSPRVLVRRGEGTRQMRMTYKHPSPTGQAVRVMHGLLNRTLEGTRQHQADWQSVSGPKLRDRSTGPVIFACFSSGNARERKA